MNIMIITKHTLENTADKEAKRTKSLDPIVIQSVIFLTIKKVLKFLVSLWQTIVNSAIEVFFFNLKRKKNVVGFCCCCWSWLQRIKLSGKIRCEAMKACFSIWLPRARFPCWRPTGVGKGCWLLYAIGPLSSGVPEWCQTATRGPHHTHHHPERRCYLSNNKRERREKKTKNEEEKKDKRNRKSHGNGRKLNEIYTTIYAPSPNKIIIIIMKRWKENKEKGK